MTLIIKILSLSAGGLLVPLFNLMAAGDPLLDLGGSSSIILVIPMFLVGVGGIFFAKFGFSRKTEKRLGFLSITPHRSQRFFPLDDSITNMVPVVEKLADEQTNVYSNLTKITLSAKSSGVFLEDKNYKISILINRRRARRSMLTDGDILDMGELTVMFRSPQEKAAKREYQAPSSGQTIPRARRTHGKILKNSPSLIPADTRQKAFYLTKNITRIGRSEMNDLVPKSKSVSPMHSRIERIAGKYKLVDLSSSQGTFVNGRRIDTKFLHDGDEVSFESIKYTFSMSGKPR